MEDTSCCSSLMSMAESRGLVGGVGGSGERQSGGDAEALVGDGAGLEVAADGACSLAQPWEPVLSGGQVLGGVGGAAVVDDLDAESVVAPAEADGGGGVPAGVLDAVGQ